MLIIAEIGQNHNGNMEIARELISAAKNNGANIAKFQLYDVDTIFPATFEWYREAKAAEMNRKQVSEMARECERVGIEFCASVFDVERLSWCEDLGVKRYKVASRSVKQKELLSAIGSTGKDMIVSLGMWDETTFPQIETLGKLDYLYCVAKYPTQYDDLHFESVSFNKYSGFSDHTIGIEASMVAVARGAWIIEKHFTLDKNMHGPDHACSMTPCELRTLCEYTLKFEKVLCNAKKSITNTVV